MFSRGRVIDSWCTSVFCCPDGDQVQLFSYDHLFSPGKGREPNLLIGESMLLLSRLIAPLTRGMMESILKNTISIFACRSALHALLARVGVMAPSCRSFLATPVLDSSICGRLEHERHFLFVGNECRKCTTSGSLM